VETLSEVSWAFLRLRRAVEFTKGGKHFGDTVKVRFPADSNEWEMPFPSSSGKHDRVNVTKRRQPQNIFLRDQFLFFGIWKSNDLRHKKSTHEHTRMITCRNDWQRAAKEK
jgi:hypothetical protein